jgi:hypothetical protein
MSDFSLDPLPDDLARMFGRANEETESEAVLARVRDGVSRSMVLRGVPGFGTPGPEGDGGGGATPAPDGGGSPGGGGSGALGGAGTITKGAAMKLAALTATAGLALGLAGGREWGASRASSGSLAATGAAPATTTSSASAPSASTLAIAGPSASTKGLEPVSIDTLPSAQGTARPQPMPSSTGEAASGRSPLRRERELVDGAAGALKNSNPRQALELAEQHARLFPTGQLAEEREVIVIEGLLALGRRTDATARLARFRANFPASPAGPRLESNISSSGP